MPLRGAGDASRRDSQNASNLARLYPCEAAKTLNGETGKAMADQIATVSKLRLQSKQGTLSDPDMRAVETAIVT